MFFVFFQLQDALITFDVNNRYIKPTKEKGPDSSICFGYGCSDDIVFPHECNARNWHCYDGTSFVREEGIVATLAYPSLELPSEILNLKAKKSQEYIAEKERQAQELLRESKPGAIEIRGATVDRSRYMNGVFEPTSEVCNDMPVYQKKGDPDTWLEMVKTTTGTWRWYIKPTKEKGPDKTVCFGYGSSEDIVLPHECDKMGWYCYDNKNFVVEEGVTCTLVIPGSLPANIIAMAQEGRSRSVVERERKDIENSRPPIAGSVIIQGATVDRAKYMNGVFEPTSEKCNGMTVYRKKGEPNVWLELVPTSNGWRWCVLISV